MEEFDFDKFEKNIQKFTELLRAQMQTRLFRCTSVPEFDLQVTIFERAKGYGKQIHVETSDLAKHMNFLMFDQVMLHNFGGSVVEGEDRLYWLPIDWRWANKDGGGNGTRAFTCRVNDDGEIVMVHN